MKKSSSTALLDYEAGCAEQLSRFFPHIKPIRVPVKVSVLRSAGAKLREAVLLEFGGPEHAIFLSTLPLEFDDRVRLQRESESRTADATVVAVQYHEGRKAVAVQFKPAPCDWVTRP